MFHCSFIMHFQLEVYSDAKKALIDERPATAEDCIRWARNLFQHEFHNEIAQLLHNFPADQLTDKGWIHCEST